MNKMQFYSLQKANFQKSNFDFLYSILLFPPATRSNKCRE